MKKFIRLFLFSFFLINTITKTNCQVLFTYDTCFTKYFAATSEPDPNWYKQGFNDTAWPKDTGIFGFGYKGIYSTINSSAKSIYMRCPFKVANKSAIKAIGFYADYDDGFIAYLNGHEIARVNVSKNKKFPAYNDLAIQSHHAEYSGLNYTYPVPGIYLDSALLDSCLVQGDNVMAIHLLNDSINGSDLWFLDVIADITYLSFNYYSDNSRYKRLINVDSTNIPLVIINTDQYGIPYDQTIHTKVFLGIIDNGHGKYNKPGDAYNVYSGLASLKLRGQSSRDFPKQSYRLELIDSLGNDTNVVILGMPKDNDWILFGPYADKSQVRNKFEYDLGKKLGEYQPRTKFCELLLNGQLVGLYNLVENIKREKHRVDIAKLEPKDQSGVAVTGGYLMKYDKDGAGRIIVYPKEEDIQPQQIAYILHRLRLGDSVLLSNGFDDPVNGFRKYFGDSSLVDYIIMNELPKNADSYLYSTYFYKDREDRDDRIKYGPLWDYDLGFGNTTFQNGNLTNGWQFEYNTKLRITRFLQDPVMVDLLQSRWHELRDGVLSNDSIFNMIDSLISEAKPQIDRNYQVWPIIDKTLFYPAYSVSTYDQEISTFKSWLSTRLTWIDNNIDLIYYKKTYTDIELAYSKAGVSTLNAYPNPFRNKITVEIQVEKQCNAKIEISNLTGQVEYARVLNVHSGSNQININDAKISKLGNGIYIMRLFIDNLPISTQKIIKN
jgi:hypothetical protein